MISNNIPYGLWPVMLTPFNKDQSIDFHLYSELIDFYINGGSAGLFACCGSSELEELEDDEIVNIAAKVIEYSDNRVPVVAGAIVYKDLVNMADFVKKIWDTGAKAVVLSTNQIAQDKDDINLWRKNLETLMKLTNDIPLGFYEYPFHRNKRLIPPVILGDIAQSKRFVFYKDTCCDIAVLKEKINMTSETPLKIFNANTQTLLDFLKAGGAGYSGTGANFCPELFSWLCSNFSRNSIIAEKIQQFLSQFESKVDQCQNYPLNAKAFLALRNVKIKPVCRVNTLPIDAAVVNILNDALKSFQETYNQYCKI